MLEMHSSSFKWHQTIQEVFNKNTGFPDGEVIKYEGTLLVLSAVKSGNWLRFKLIKVIILTPFSYLGSHIIIFFYCHHLFYICQVAQLINFLPFSYLCCLYHIILQ